MNTLSYLAEHKAAFIGGTATILEILTLIINWWRRLMAKNNVELMGLTDNYAEETKLQKFLWIANPLNLYRRI